MLGQTTASSHRPRATSSSVMPMGVRKSWRGGHRGRTPPPRPANPVSSPRDVAHRAMGITEVGSKPEARRAEDLRLGEGALRPPEYECAEPNLHVRKRGMRLGEQRIERDRLMYNSRGPCHTHRPSPCANDGGRGRYTFVRIRTGWRVPGRGAGVRRVGVTRSRARSPAPPHDAPTTRPATGRS